MTNTHEANEAFFTQLEKMPVPAGYKVGQAGASNDMDDSFANMAMALGLGRGWLYPFAANPDDEPGHYLRHAANRIGHGPGGRGSRPDGPCDYRRCHYLDLADTRRRADCL